MAIREDDLPDANDLYGIAKMLGEVDCPGAITLRTSIIGHEIAIEERFAGMVPVARRGMPVPHKGDFFWISGSSARPDRLRRRVAASGSAWHLSRCNAPDIEVRPSAVGGTKIWFIDPARAG